MTRKLTILLLDSQKEKKTLEIINS